MASMLFFYGEAQKYDLLEQMLLLLKFTVQNSIMPVGTAHFTDSTTQTKNRLNKHAFPEKVSKNCRHLPLVFSQ